MPPNLFLQKDLQCLGLSILGNLSQCLVSDLAHTFSLQVHILTNLCERDVRSSDALEFLYHLCLSFVQISHAVLQVLHQETELRALVGEEGVFVDEDVEQ